jgi:hypothetical protein
MKWNNHIKYLSSELNTSYMINSLKKVMSRCLKNPVLCMFSCSFEIRFDPVGGDLEIIQIFWIQRKVIRIIGKVDRRISCLNLFKDLNILPVPCMYISKVVI